MWEKEWENLGDTSGTVPTLLGSVGTSQVPEVPSLDNVKNAISSLFFFFYFLFAKLNELFLSVLYRKTSLSERKLWSV